ncbi:hypothetical protein [Sporosarcina phage Lietuvens]|nr:hypothetical protein [Sporosarcina phage Lietuvens]
MNNEYGWRMNIETNPRPPVGVVPERIWKAERRRDLSAAIMRYLHADYPIPDGWIEEYNDLVKEASE